MTMEQTEQIDTTPVGTDPLPTAPPVAEVQPEVPTEGADATQPEGEIPSAPEPDVAPAPPPALPGEVPTNAPVPTPQYTPQQWEQVQRNSAEFERVQAKATLQQHADTRRQQLETQGYLPEQAQYVAEQEMKMTEEFVSLASKSEEFGRHLQGKQLAAEEFARRYGLGIDDLTTLRAYDDRGRMEAAAKQLSTNRQRDAELASFKKAQVPSQSFDNSQGNPQVAADEGSWLDRYNAGDRSPSAAAAAKRAAGIG